MQLGRDDPTALPANTSLIVDNGATFDLNGNSFTDESALNSVTLNNGIIESTRGNNATIEVTSLIDVGYGSISASMTGSATLVKSPGFGDLLPGSPPTR